MRGISTKVITDEQTVRMHTNFAEFKDVRVAMAKSDMATWSKEDGVLKVHTNTIHGWIYVFCEITHSLLKYGKKYGISFRSRNHNLGISLQNGSGTYVGEVIVAPQWDGDKISSVCMLKEADHEIIDKDLGITSYLSESNTDYELRDFRIWEIDDFLGGAIVSILFIMLATSPRKEVAA